MVLGDGIGLLQSSQFLLMPLSRVLMAHQAKFLFIDAAGRGSEALRNGTFTDRAA